MSTNVVKFDFDRVSNPTMKEKVIESPDPSLINLTIVTVMEVNFEMDAYYADFKIYNKQVNQLKNNEGVDITEYVYLLKYIPHTTRTKTELEKTQEKVDDEKMISNFLNP